MCKRKRNRVYNYKRLQNVWYKTKVKSVLYSGTCIVCCHVTNVPKALVDQEQVAESGM